jgi:hypothetical protein
LRASQVDGRDPAVAKLHTRELGLGQNESREVAVFEQCVANSRAFEGRAEEGTADQSTPAHDETGGLPVSQGAAHLGVRPVLVALQQPEIDIVTDLIEPRRT